MKLSILLEHIINKDIALPECKRQCLNYDPDITSIHYQSQTVKPGGLFVAIPGNKADGNDFIDDAIKRGAATLVVEKRMNTKAIEIKVQNSRKALSVLSNRFYNNPSEKLCVIGVTGTNGKTTTTYIIENILAKAGFKTGVLGTINYRHSGKIFKAPMTTPESLDLQEILFEMFNEGITHVVMEVSSHAIDLCRVDNCYFDIGVFTNLTQDHLDFHKDMDTYWSCKKRLFTEILATGPKSGKAIAVINCSNDKGNELYKSCALKKISVGFSKDDYLSVSG